MMNRSAKRKLQEEEEESQTEPKCRNGVKVKSDPEISAPVTKIDDPNEFQNIPQQHQEPDQDPVTEQPVLTEQDYQDATNCADKHFRHLWVFLSGN